MPTTFTNQATLSYNEQTIPSNVVTGVLTEVLSVSKTAIPATYQEGDTITYAVQMVNAGATELTGLTLTDNLGAYTLALGGATVVPMTYQADTLRYYQNGVLQATPTIAATSPLTVTGLSIPAGGNITLMYAARTNQFTPYGAETSVTNTATVTGGGLAAPLTAEATVNANTAPNLSVIKAMCPMTVTENGALTYTFTLQNRGATATTAADNVSLTDTFTPPLTITRVTLNGTALTAGTDYTYDGTTFRTLTPLLIPAATYTRDATTGAVTTVPGTAALVVEGTI